MADAADSKSADSNIVWVQVPPPAPSEKSRCTLRKEHVGFFNLSLSLCLVLI